MDYLTIKWLHILSSTVLFGTGIGSAFYLLAATLSRDLVFLAGVTRWVVRADWLFTATTAVLQPLTGLWLVHSAGYPLAARWLMVSIVLYAVAIACWIPVVVLQLRMRDEAARSVREAAPLSARYWRMFGWWVALGTVAFALFLAIFYLMTTKPMA
jgi:uncharacterized membrane protein